MFPGSPSSVTLAFAGLAHFIGGRATIGLVMSADGQFVTYDPDGAIYLVRPSNRRYQRPSPLPVARLFHLRLADRQFWTAISSSIRARTAPSRGFSSYNNDAFPIPAHYGGQITKLMSREAQPAISGDGSKIRGRASWRKHRPLSIKQGHELANFTAAALGTTGTLGTPAISAVGHIIAFWASDLVVAPEAPASSSPMICRPRPSAPLAK